MGSSVHSRFGKSAYVAVSGAIDESFSGINLGADDASAVVLDLAGIERITSFGVRLWMDALRGLANVDYYFTSVPPVVLVQFNMVAGFGVNGTIVSLYAPYLCRDCHTEINVLVDLRRVSNALLERGLPAPACHACGSSNVEFDDVEEVYFSYVMSRPPPQLSPIAARLIDGRAQERPGLSIKKEINGGLTTIALSGVLDERQHLRRAFDGLDGNVLVLCDGIGTVEKTGVDELIAAMGATEATYYFARLRSPLLEFGHRVNSSPNIVVASCELAVGGAGDREHTLVSADGDWPALPHEPRTRGLYDIARSIVSNAIPGPILQHLSRPDKDAQSHGDVRRMVLGRYTLIRMLAVGGMGQIYLARQSSGAGFERDVIVKCLRMEHRDEAGMVEMFLQEGRLASIVSHPNVVTILDFGRDGDGYYLAMELVRGWDLATILGALRRSGERMPDVYACRVVSQTCAALSAAHNAVDPHGRPVEIVHRDISPSNLMLMGTGDVKVADFGIAKLAEARSQTDPQLLKGKLPYVAPEQLDACRSIDRRVDIFAAGAVLVECLALVQPFDGFTARDPAKALALLEVERPGLPGELRAVVARALAAAPEDRYQSARDMELALERYISSTGETVTAAALGDWLARLPLPPINLGRPPNDSDHIATQVDGADNSMSISAPKSRPGSELTGPADS